MKETDEFVIVCVPLASVVAVAWFATFNKSLVLVTFVSGVAGRVIVAELGL